MKHDRAQPGQALWPSGGGLIIVPAHNEAAVIVRCLDALLDGLDPQVTVVVACNGCTDDTPQLAGNVSDRVSVLELQEQSKSRALRAAERAFADIHPRLYVDADVVLSGSSASLVLRYLASESSLAARPAAMHDKTGSGRIIRRYYRARSRVPEFSRRLWGAGVYGLSAQGRARFESFPEVLGDDLFVDQLFSAEEINILDCDPVIVRTPRRLHDLLKQLARVNDGNRELVRARSAEGTARSTASVVLRTGLLGPTEAIDAVVYMTVTILGRIYTIRSGRVRWNRDQSSRENVAFSL